jgi:hypothetical protein
MRDTRNPYSRRDWGMTLGALGLLLLSTVATLCALGVTAASIWFLFNEGHPGYVLVTAIALGFGCIFASGIKWAFDSMRDA